MAFMDWGPELSVGFEEIDNDHKKLIELLNSLSDAVAMALEDAVVGQFLEDLLSYTMWHFRHEEQLMQTHGYPEFLEHETQHGKLAETVADLQRRYREAGQDVAAEAMSFTKAWLTNHVLGTDRKLGAFLSARVQ